MNSKWKRVMALVLVGVLILSLASTMLLYLMG